MFQVRGLTVDLAGRSIVSGVSFDVPPGAIVGLFGESGCGKTTLALALLGLLPAGPYAVGGSATLRGEELIGRSERDLQRLRGAAVSMIFQDPLLALNPVLRVRDQIREVARAHGAPHDPAALLDSVGLPATPRILRSYPHMLSGGERQRVLIAQALVCRPALVIADEPFTALDPLRVVELARLFQNLKQATGSSFLVISHSPGVLARIADSVLVMSAGRIVEQGPPTRLFRSPEHPYTAAVVEAAGA
jgi:ABC-type glutathione transport system ATPase component